MSSLAKVEELKAALSEQRSPLSHLDNAHQEAWALVYARSARDGQTPAGAWMTTRSFLEDSRPILKRHREALDQHATGVERAAKLDGPQRAQYLARMGEHFSGRVRELEDVKERLLDASAKVGPEAERAQDEELKKVDSLLALMSYAVGDLRRRAGEYQQGLESPEPKQDLIADLVTAPAQATVSTIDHASEVSEGVVFGETTPAPKREEILARARAEGQMVTASGLRVAPEAVAPAVAAASASMGPAELAAYIRETYDVDLHFGPDGRPVLSPIGDLGKTVRAPDAGLAIDHSPRQGYAYGH